MEDLQYARKLQVEIDRANNRKPVYASYDKAPIPLLKGQQQLIANENNFEQYDTPLNGDYEPLSAPTKDGIRAPDGQRVDRLINDEDDRQTYKRFVRAQEKLLSQYERAKTTKEVIAPGQRLSQPLLTGGEIDIEDGKGLVDAGGDYQKSVKKKKKENAEQKEGEKREE